MVVLNKVKYKTKGTKQPKNASIRAFYPAQTKLHIRNNPRINPVQPHLATIKFDKPFAHLNLITKHH